MNNRSLIIIPAFNEEENIACVIKDIRNNHPSLSFVVINDGSEDNTQSVLKKNNASYITHPINLGYGASLKTGCQYALKNDYDFVIQFDGDCQHRADQIQKLFSAYQEGKTDIVIGSRYKKDNEAKLSIAKKLAHKIFSALIHTKNQNPIKDVTSGFQLLNKKAYSYFAFLEDFPTQHPDANFLLLSSKVGFKLSEIPVLMKERGRGASMFTRWKTFFYVIEMIITIFVIYLRSGGKNQ
ncbi:glycosyltransferase family 2 protein [bacterium]|nr:glycosyltransferase family 2 protein [bacterium]